VFTQDRNVVFGVREPPAPGSACHYGERRRGGERTRDANRFSGASPWHAASRSPGPARVDVITAESCPPRSWSTRWLPGRPERGRLVFNAGQRRRADHDAGHPATGGSLLGAELISRYGVPPSQHR